MARGGPERPSPASRWSPPPEQAAQHREDGVPPVGALVALPGRVLVAGVFVLGVVERHACEQVGEALALGRLRFRVLRAEGGLGVLGRAFIAFALGRALVLCSRLAEGLDGLLADTVPVVGLVRDAHAEGVRVVLVRAVVLREGVAGERPLHLARPGRVQTFEVFGSELVEIGEIRLAGRPRGPSGAPSLGPVGLRLGPLGLCGRLRRRPLGLRGRLLRLRRLTLTRPGGLAAAAIARRARPRGLATAAVALAVAGLRRGGRDNERSRENRGQKRLHSWSHVGNVLRCRERRSRAQTHDSGETCGPYGKSTKRGSGRLPPWARDPPASNRTKGPSVRPLQVDATKSGYLISTVAPAASSCSLIESASSRATPSLTALGAPSTRSFASLRPRPVTARTSLITWIFLSPAPVRRTSNSVCSSPSAAPSPAAAGAAPGAATATGAAAVTPHSSSIFFFSSTRSRTVIFPSSSNTLSTALAAITPPPWSLRMFLRGFPRSVARRAPRPLRAPPRPPLPPPGRPRPARRTGAARRGRRAGRRGSGAGRRRARRSR